MPPTIRVNYEKGTPINWRTRALLAEAELALTRTCLETANQHLQGIELRLRNRAALISITRTGRELKFAFVRNGKYHIIETYGTISDDVTEWKRTLLEDLPE